MFARTILQRSIGAAKAVNVKASSLRHFSALPTKITTDYGSIDGKFCALIIRKTNGAQSILISHTFIFYFIVMLLSCHMSEGHEKYI